MERGARHRVPGVAAVRVSYGSDCQTVVEMPKKGLEIGHLRLLRQVALGGMTIQVERSSGLSRSALLDALRRLRLIDVQDGRYLLSDDVVFSLPSRGR